MDRHMIIDNVMTVEDQLKIIKNIHFLNFQYNCNTCDSATGQVVDDEIYDVGQLVSSIFGEFTKEQEPFPVRAVFPLIRSVEHHLKSEEQFKRILINRVKVNLLWKSPEAAGRWNTPHTDVSNVDEFVSAIYYVKDSDGDTCLFYPDELVRVTPKQGRILIFPSTLKHASSSPMVSYDRVVINMVLKLDR